MGLTERHIWLEQQLPLFAASYHLFKTDVQHQLCVPGRLCVCLGWGL